jgi:hypothetical protein
MGGMEGELGEIWCFREFFRVDVGGIIESRGGHDAVITR